MPTAGLAHHLESDLAGMEAAATNLQYAKPRVLYFTELVGPDHFHTGAQEGQACFPTML